MSRHAGSLALRIVVVAGAYFLAGRFSVFLTIPPEYATAAWPPAGIALAAVVLLGFRILPGVFLGALGLNVFLSGDPVIASSIALGATLQAAAGGWLARRVAGPGNPLDAGGSALPTSFVAGPFSCLVSSTWGVATLSLAGSPSVRDLPYAWTTWFVGDSIGVLVFLPILLSWTARPAETWRVRRWTLTGPLVVCLGLVALFFLYAREAEERRTRTEFEDRQRPIGSSILQEMGSVISSVKAVGSLYRASTEVTRDEFATFAGESLEALRGVRALEWAPRVLGSEREAFERKAVREGVEGYRIRELDGTGNLQPVEERSHYYPVTFVEPVKGNEAAMGFDLASEPVRNAAMESAIRRAAPTISGRIELVQDDAPTSSVILFVPVYAGNEPPADPNLRDAGVKGLALGVLVVEELLGQAVRTAAAAGLAIMVRDVDASGNATILFSSGTIDPMIEPAYHDWKDAGRDWQIEIGATGPPPRSWTTWFVLAGGLVFTGLFGAFVLELSTRHVHVETLVAVRTRELARSNEELQRSNLELQRFANVASHDLREPLRAIGSYAQLLGESADELQTEHKKYLERIAAAARRMQALVDDLLTVSRVEGGASARAPVSLEKLLGFAIENLRPAIEAAHARIEVGALPTVNCDASQIVQLFQNLVANAVKFRREQAVPIVRISCRLVGDEYEISVKDNGIGIAPEHHGVVFEMFERLHNREKYGGTGIGLAICRRIVDRHGGRIWIESPPEGGSVFRFTLPAQGDLG